MLRVRLHRLTALDDPDTFPLILEALRTLTRLVQAHHRITPTSTDQLYEAVVGVVKGLGDIFLPEEA